MAAANVGGLRRQSSRIVAILLVLGALSAVYASERPPTIDLNKRPYHFAFTRSALPEVPGPEVRVIRQVQPPLEHIAAFISTIGAGVALADIAGTGLPQDVCYIDTRTDQIIVAPAPGTGDRYKPFALNANLRQKLFDRATMAPAGCIPADVDEDGRVDLLVYYADRTPILFLSRPGAPNEQPSAQNFVPVDIIPGGEKIVTGAATFADLDGTGHLDLVLADYFQDGVAIFDRQETVPAYMPDSFSRADNGGGPRIYRCLPTTEGAERSVACSRVEDAFPPDTRLGWGLAVGAYDIAGNGLPELYVANDFGPDQFFHNQSTPGHIKLSLLKGRTSPATPSSMVVGRDSYKGMGIDFADLNGDGIPDFVVSSITEHNFLENQQAFLSTGTLAPLEHGVAPYTEDATGLGLSHTGWAWDIKFGDFDNSGILSIVQATGFLKGTRSKWSEIHELAMVNDSLVRYTSTWPLLQLGDDVAGHDQNPFFVRKSPDGPFVDISKEIGFGEDNPSRGIAIADTKGDGKLDIAVANMWGPSSFYQNTCDNCGKALEISLRYPIPEEPGSATVVQDGHPRPDQPTRAAIGAEVDITMPDGKHQYAQVDGGSGHSGKRAPDMHFGLGTVSEPVRVDLKWRYAGQLMHETLTLAPGWHTVILGIPRELSRLPTNGESVL